MQRIAKGTSRHIGGQETTTITTTPHTLRPDLSVIAEMIPAEARVLDLGCGDGALLEYLIKKKQVMGRGIELSERDILTCVRRGLSVRHGNLEEGLADYPDASFDYVTLSQTLHFLDDPRMILHEMLRVGNQVIVSFPNWGYWRHRLHFLLQGRIPPAQDVCEQWHQAPRWQAFTITDFGIFCRKLDIRVNAQVYLTGKKKLPPTRWKNLFATTAIFTLQRIKEN